MMTVMITFHHWRKTQLHSVLESLRFSTEWDTLVLNSIFESSKGIVGVYFADFVEM